MMMTIYSGLCVSQLKLSDIRSSEQLIIINQANGNKDRAVALPDNLLTILRRSELCVLG